jgi:hypothetical protein
VPALRMHKLAMAWTMKSRSDNVLIAHQAQLGEGARCNDAHDRANPCPDRAPRCQGDIRVVDRRLDDIIVSVASINMAAEPSIEGGAP